MAASSSLILQLTLHVRQLKMDKRLTDEQKLQAALAGGRRHPSVEGNDSLGRVAIDVIQLPLHSGAWRGGSQHSPTHRSFLVNQKTARFPTATCGSPANDLMS